MNAKINQELFNTITVDSGALGPLAMVLHRFAEPGRYEVSVFRDGKPAGSRSFVVNEAAQVGQLNIDLSSAERGGASCDCRTAEDSEEVSPQGYVLFHSSRGSGYSARVSVGKRLVFDTTALGEGDLFAASLLKPGRYAVSESESGAKAALVVEALHAGMLKEFGGRLEDLPPVQIDVKDGFQPAEIRARSAQGLVFSIHRRARVVIESVDKGPRTPRRHAGYHWKRPPTRSQPRGNAARGD